MNKLKIAVVGAGITGATVANILATLGHDIFVYERDKIGGACSDSYEDYTYMQNHGSHIFHTNDEEVYKFLSMFTKWLPYQHKVKALLNGVEVPVPFNLNSIENYLSKASLDTFESIADSANLPYYSELTLDDLLNSNEVSFKELGNLIWAGIFKKYSIKQWGKIPDIEVLNRVKAFRYSTDDRYFTDKYQGIPFDGFSKMIRNMLYAPNTYILNIMPAIEDLSTMDYVIYTGSIDELFDYKLGELPYRTCEFIYKRCHGRRVQSGAAVINYPNDYEFTRSHDYSWYMPDSRDSIIAYEYPKAFSIDKGDERYYPIQEKENLELYQKYLELAKKELPNYYFIGRLGSYKYLNMDQAVRQALDFVKQFVENL